MRRLLALSLILSLSGCAGGKGPAGPPSAAPPPTLAPVPLPPATPAPPPSAAELAGGWDRAIRSGVAGREGFVLAAGGRLGLLGIFGMDGVAWRLEGDVLVLSTNTERDPEPAESRLRVEQLTQARLVLGGEGYLAGTWERREFRDIAGVVTYRQRSALTPEALVQIELRDVSRQDAEAPLLARRVIHRPGQVPVSFVLDYDPSSVLPGRTYAISARIADRGQLQFVTDTRIPVIHGGTEGPVEIVVVPVR